MLVCISVDSTDSIIEVALSYSCAVLSNATELSSSCKMPFSDVIDTDSSGKVSAGKMLSTVPSNTVSGKTSAAAVVSCG